MDGDDNGSPTAANGKVFVGTLSGSLYAIDQVTGDVQWRAPTGQGNEVTPAVANGVVYSGDNEGNFSAFRASDGTVLWTRRPGQGQAFILSSPIVANGVVYAATVGTYAYDTVTGALLWRGRTALVNSSLALVDGVLYVADFSGTVRAFGLPSS